MFPNTKLTNRQKNAVVFIAFITLPIWLIPALVLFYVYVVFDTFKTALFEPSYNDCALRWKHYKEVHGIKE